MYYIFEQVPSIRIPEGMDSGILETFLQNYTYGRKWEILAGEEQNAITIGNGVKADLESAEYVIQATESGVYVGGRDASSLMRGFLAFLERIRYLEEEDSFAMDTCCILGSPRMMFRCVHLCVFPETKLDFLRKCVRASAIAGFSYVIFEFWGMLKYDCMKELSWPFAYSKEQIREIVAEANALGMEVIPMFNHLGHASACREINGKHVVLDQNPRYEYLYESYGWIWKFQREDVAALLKHIREELIEVCGNGSYFHLGCDEAYAYGHQQEKALEWVAYLNEVAREMAEKGRRCIIWHDMLISREDFEGYVANSDKQVSQLLIEKLDRNIIIADWEYSPHGERWKTSQYFKEKGFTVICCPWDNKKNITEAVETVTDGGLHGIIHTTWHTLHRGFREMVYAGVISYGTRSEELDDLHRFYCAAVARKAMPSYGNYERSGWSEKMTGPGL